MSYNTELQTNNTDLEGILASVRNLPTAGGGGSMSDAEIAALLAYANSKTGADDPTLDEAVRTLCDGYGSTFPFGGSNPVLVDQLTKTYGLGDTSYNPETAYSTSNNTIKTATANEYQYLNMDINNYDYVLVQEAYSIPTYSSVINPHMIVTVSAVATYYGLRSTSTSAESRNALASVTGTMTGLCFCVGSTGAEVSSTNFFGVFAQCNTGTINGTANARTNGPVIYARSNTSYASQDSIKAIESCQMVWNVKLYRVDKDSTPASAIFERVRILSNV